MGNMGKDWMKSPTAPTSIKHDPERHIYAALQVARCRPMERICANEEGGLHKIHCLLTN